jgi:hypothetical protein
MAYPEKKEINLFGDKSIREEAYRKKILQLEQEIARIEVLAKEQDESIPIAPSKQPKNLNNLYYESLMSFDVRLKKEQEFFEKRATEITERLDLKVQRSIIDIENVYRKKIRKLFFSGFLFIAIFISIAIYLNTQILPYKTQIRHAAGSENRISYIMDALSSQTKYHHQYEVGGISIIDDKYIVYIRLNNAPISTWYLRDMAQEAVKVFNRFSGYAAAEISISHNDKLYAKASLPGASNAPYIRYFY